MNALERRIANLERTYFPQEIVFLPLKSNPLAYPDEPQEPWPWSEANPYTPAKARERDGPWTLTFA